MEQYTETRRERLEKIFASLGDDCKEPKFKEFQFKFIHKINVTKKELSRYGIKTETNVSTAASRIQSIIHLLNANM